MGSITPRPNSKPETRFQPSMLSVPSAAATVPPEKQARNATQLAPKRSNTRKLWWFGALSAFVGALSVGVLRPAAHVSADVRSGSPGYRQSPAGHDLHWQKKPLTIYLDGSLTQLGPGANEAIMQAFGQWVGSDPRLPDLSFDTSTTSTVPVQDGKSTVSYGHISAPGHEHDVAITITYSNDKTGEIIEADVILNALYPMGVLTAAAAAPPAAAITTAPRRDDKGDKGDKDERATGVTANTKSMNGGVEAVDCRNRYDAQNVATHEAGHFFGLGEDLVKSNAAMFQIIDQCETHKRALATTDVGAISVLYAQSADPEESAAGARACSFGGVPEGGSGLAVSGLILGLSLLSRRRAR